MDILQLNLQRLSRYTGSIAWGPVVAFSRTAILSYLAKIRLGQLKISEHGGHQTVCGGTGQDGTGPIVGLSVYKETFWVRTLLFADMVG